MVYSGGYQDAAWKGTNGVSANGFTANFVFFDSLFLGTPVNYFYLPKSTSAYFFPNLTKSITFAASPLVLTPFVCNQAARAGIRTKRRMTKALAAPPAHFWRLALRTGFHEAQSFVKLDPIWENDTVYTFRIELSGISLNRQHLRNIYLGGFCSRW